MQISSILSVTGGIDAAYKAMCRPVLEQFGLPQISFDILMFLANHPQYYTASQISALRHLKPNVVSLHVEKLVQEKLIARESVNGDRRKVKLVLMPKSNNIVLGGRRIQISFYKALTKGLTDEELETFRHCVATAGENADHIRNHPELFLELEEYPC